MVHKDCEFLRGQNKPCQNTQNRDNPVEHGKPVDLMGRIRVCADEFFFVFQNNFSPGGQKILFLLQNYFLDYNTTYL